MNESCVNLETDYLTDCKYLADWLSLAQGYNNRAPNEK